MKLFVFDYIKFKLSVVNSFFIRSVFLSFRMVSVEVKMSRFLKCLALLSVKGRISRAYFS